MSTRNEEDPFFWIPYWYLIGRSQGRRPCERKKRWFDTPPHFPTKFDSLEVSSSRPRQSPAGNNSMIVVPLRQKITFNICEGCRSEKVKSYSTSNLRALSSDDKVSICKRHSSLEEWMCLLFKVDHFTSRANWFNRLLSPFKRRPAAHSFRADVWCEKNERCT